MTEAVQFQGTWTLTSSDGSVHIVNDARMTPSAATGPTGPSPAPNAATIGNSTHALAAINPTGTAFPGGRGPNELVLYRDPVVITATNQYGAELPVLDVAGTLNDRQASASTNGTPVPVGGYVLSGHGTSRDWLIANATSGLQVTLAHQDAPTGPSGPTGPTGPGAATRTLAVYLMLWPGVGTMDNVPAQCNEVRLAFAQGSPPSLVGWTSDGQQQLVAKLAAFRARGGRVLVSVGGQGGHVNISDRAGFLRGITQIKTDLGGNLDGLDWDLEAVSMNTSDVLAINQALKQAYGSNFKISFAPNGGNVGSYLPAAVASQKAGCLDFYAQQFYDANVSFAAALGRIQEAMAAGIPATKLGVGMMIQGDANHWTNSQCLDYYTRLKAAVPGLAGAYLWETHRAGTGQWASDLAPIVLA
jgi:Glycosyl hydrolases family 18